MTGVDCGVVSSGGYREEEREEREEPTPPKIGQLVRVGHSGPVSTLSLFSLVCT